MYRDVAVGSILLSRSPDRIHVLDAECMTYSDKWARATEQKPIQSRRQTGNGVHSIFPSRIELFQPFSA